MPEAWARTVPTQDEKAELMPVLHPAELDHKTGQPHNVGTAQPLLLIATMSLLSVVSHVRDKNVRHEPSSYDQT
jgi:hypothetical protein